MGGPAVTAAKAAADGRPGAGDEVFSPPRDSPLGPEPYLDRHVDTGGERQGVVEG
ncbi:hypothetical protein ABT084_34890 [Streptomyces sp. NPDC002138]|uniref:hypothetical protein n=1 Tax=Streptomyces sp. NPDC002138 TaxID=3154410 RepID=UPI0033246DE7